MPRPSVRLVTWRRGVLTIRLKSIPKGARLHAKVTFARRKPMNLVTKGLRLRARTPLPKRLQLRQSSSRRVERYRLGQSDPAAPMTRALGRALLVAAATAVCLAAALTGPALPGSYSVNACSPSTSSGLWAAVEHVPDELHDGQQLRRPSGSEIGPLDGSNQGALYAEDILGSADQHARRVASGMDPQRPARHDDHRDPLLPQPVGLRAAQRLGSGLVQADGAVLEECRIETPFGSSTRARSPTIRAR